MGCMQVAQNALKEKTPYILRPHSIFRTLFNSTEEFGAPEVTFVPLPPGLNVC